MHCVICNEFLSDFEASRIDVRTRKTWICVTNVGRTLNLILLTTSIWQQRKT
jgi:hypothetical protein